jgi:hypothetical protein
MGFIAFAEKIWVHERLAAGEADLARANGGVGGFHKERCDFGACDIDQRIILGRAFDVAALARDVAQRAGVEPQRREAVEWHCRAALALGGPDGIDEFFALNGGAIENAGIAT